MPTPDHTVIKSSWQSANNKSDQTEKSITVTRAFEIDSAAVSPQSKISARVLERGNNSVEQQRPRAPQFQQSRKWARVYLGESNQRRPQVGRILSDAPALRPLSRDFFTRTELHAVPNRVSAYTDSDSESIHNGLCRSDIIPGWRNFRASKLIPRHAVPFSFLRRSESHRRQQSVKSHNIATSSNSSRASLPKRVGGNRLKLMKGVQDLRSQAKMVDGSGMASGINHSGLVVDLDGIRCKKNSSRVSVLSIHDPDKDRRFSEECEELLSNSAFEQDWTKNAAPGPLTGTNVKNRAPRSSLLSHKIRDDLSRWSRIGDIRSSLSPRSSSEPTVSDTAPRIPIECLKSPSRPSNDIGTEAGRVVAPSKTTRYPLQTVTGQPARVNCQPGSYSSQYQRPGQSRMLAFYQAQPPTQTVRLLRHSPSVSTLAMIEAQIQAESTESPAVQYSDGPTVLSVASIQSSTPSGDPPGRPLPQLPHTAGHIQDGGSTSSGYCSPRSSPSRLARTEASCVGSPPRPSTVTTIINVSSSEQAQSVTTPEISLAEKSFARVIPEPAQNDGLCGFASIRESISASPSPSVSPPPKRLLMNSKRLSDRSRIVHQAKKKHILALQNNLRSPPTEALDASNIGPSTPGSMFGSLAQSPLLSTANVSSSEPDEENIMSICQSRFSIDELDQFPEAPTSRPEAKSSRIHASPTHSGRETYDKSRSSLEKIFSLQETVSPREECDDKSIMTPYQRTEVLEQSNIMVVVDTDPAFPYGFRAGAMSPSQSMISSLRASPTQVMLETSFRPDSPLTNRPATASSLPNTGVKKKRVSRRKGSARSLQSQTTANLSPRNKSTRSNTDYGSPSTSKLRSLANISSSDDETTRSFPAPDPVRLTSSRRRPNPEQHDSWSTSVSSRSLCLMKEDLGEKLKRVDQRLEAMERHEEYVLKLTSELEKTKRVYGAMFHSRLSESVSAARSTQFDSDTDELEKLIRGAWRSTTGNHRISNSTTNSTVPRSSVSNQSCPPIPDRLSSRSIRRSGRSGRSSNESTRVHHQKHRTMRTAQDVRADTSASEQTRSSSSDTNKRWTKSHDSNSSINEPLSDHKTSSHSDPITQSRKQDPVIKPPTPKANTKAYLRDPSTNFPASQNRGLHRRPGLILTEDADRGIVIDEERTRRYREDYAREHGGDALEGEEKRLSVNHVLVDVKSMDRIVDMWRV